MTVDQDGRFEARGLLQEVRGLRDDVAASGREMFRRWRPKIERVDFAPSALNLGHYLAMRRHDLRPLQRRLMALGLSSLGRAEGRVLASLDAVLVALASLAGEVPPGGPKAPSARHFFRGEGRLAANADALFGPRQSPRPGRIMVTLATEAADDPTLLGRVVEAGADVVRINCAHDDPATWARMIAQARNAGQRSKRNVRILMDLAGPKVRTANVTTPSDRNRLLVGDELLLRRRPAPDVAGFATGCTLPQVLGRLKIGNRVSLDDGKLRGRIVREEAGGFVVQIEDGQAKGLKLKAEKGLNFPDVDLGLEPLTEEDRDHLDFVAEHADLVGYSFVQSADHVALLQDELKARRADWRHLGLIAKIETPQAVRNLPEIIAQGAGRQPMGVMIARGDLAVELGFERVAEMQEEILWICEAASVPVIWATQVLESLVSKGLPSRGEMTDAAMSARAECVMLNKGPHIVAGVEVLDRLLAQMGEHQSKKTPTLRALRSW